MTDTKRHSMGGKVPVATPNISSSTVSQEAALSAAIGAQIRVQTTGPTPHTVEGTLYTVSASLNLLTLTSPSPAAPTTLTYTLIPLSSLTTFTLLSLPTTPFNGPANPPLPPADYPAMQARLAATLATLRAEDARIGKNVTREAQDIFDALERTLPTRWDGVNIIVSDAVMIVPPYRSEDCKAGTGAATQSLGRVKIVLEKERKKLAEKAGTNKAAVPAAMPLSGERKGG